MAKSIQKGNPFMKKETKNIITREFIEKELRFFNTADIRSTLVLCAIFLFLAAIIIIPSFFGIFGENVSLALRILLFLLVAIPTSAPFFICLFSLAISLKERKKLQRGDFEIVTRQLLYKSEELRNCNSTVELLHFSGFDKVSSGHTVFQLASAGDEFYIVHYKGKSTIKLFYPAAMYEYKER